MNNYYEIAISKANSGRIVSKEIRQKISDKLKGNTPWNKGLRMADETCRKMSLAKIGKDPWNKGRKCPEQSGLNNPRGSYKHYRIVKIK